MTELPPRDGQPQNCTECGEYGATRGGKCGICILKPVAGNPDGVGPVRDR